MLMDAQVQLPHCLGAWFMTLDLENFYWQNTIASRYQCFLEIQVEVTVQQFTILPYYDLNLETWVSTKTIKPILPNHGTETIMYLNDRLIQALAHLQCDVHRDPTLSQQKTFLFNLTESHLTPPQTVVWLGVLRNSTIHLSQDNHH